MSAILIPLDLSVKYVAWVFFYVKKLEDFKNSCCHCQKQLFHRQISIFLAEKCDSKLFLT